MKLPMPGAAAAIPTAMNAARAAPGRATQTKQAAIGQTPIRPLRTAGRAEEVSRGWAAEASRAAAAEKRLVAEALEIIES